MDFEEVYYKLTNFIDKQFCAGFDNLPRSLRYIRNQYVLYVVFEFKIHTQLFK